MGTKRGKYRESTLPILPHICQDLRAILKMALLNLTFRNVHIRIYGEIWNGSSSRANTNTIWKMCELDIAICLMAAAKLHVRTELCMSQKICRFFGRLCILQNSSIQQIRLGYDVTFTGADNIKVASRQLTILTKTQMTHNISFWI